ncbi:hypothetical protein ACFLWA_10760 [Chloroflexota bacterium]
MKKRTSIVGIVLMLSLLIVMVGPAGAQTYLAYDSCIQVQNLSSSDAANIVVMYFQQGNETAVASPGAVVPAGGSITFCPLSAVAGGFNGSVVIESDQPVAAITNVTGGNWNAFDASYVGFDSGAQEVNIPLLHFNNWGWYSWFNVQNVGDSTATVDIVYSDGTSEVIDAQIKPNTSMTFDQALEPHSQAVFAATVTSDEPVVVTVMEVAPDMLLAYNGFTDSHPMPVMPLVQANNWGYVTGIQIMNTSGPDRLVTVTYTATAAGTDCTQTKNIPANQSATFALTAWDVGDASGDNNCVNGETFVGSAAVTDAGAATLVAIANQHNYDTAKGAAYAGFNPDSATDTVSFPLIADRNWEFFTGYNVQNVGTAATTVNCTFSNNGRTVGPMVLQPGEAFTDVQLNLLGNPYVGSSTCTATGGDTSIVGVANYLKSASEADTFQTYEGFNP